MSKRSQPVSDTEPETTDAGGVALAEPPKRMSVAETANRGREHQRTVEAELYRAAIHHFENPGAGVEPASLKAMAEECGISDKNDSHYKIAAGEDAYSKFLQRIESIVDTRTRAGSDAHRKRLADDHQAKQQHAKAVAEQQQPIIDAAQAKIREAQTAADKAGNVLQLAITAANTLRSEALRPKFVTEALADQEQAFAREVGADRATAEARIESIDGILELSGLALDQHCALKAQHDDSYKDMLEYHEGDTDRRHPIRLNRAKWQAHCEQLRAERQDLQKAILDTAPAKAAHDAECNRIASALIPAK